MIRTLLGGDGPFVWQITQSADFSAPWSKDNIVQEIEIGLSLSSWSSRGELQAFVLFRELPDAIEISWLATAVEWQSQGLMSKLMALIGDAYRHKSAIWLEVHEDNFRAQRFYEKNGFQLQGRRSKYYGGVKDALLYSKALSLSPC